MARPTAAAPRPSTFPRDDVPTSRGRRLAPTLAWGSVALALTGGALEMIGAGGYRMQWWSVGAGISVLGIGAIVAAVAAVLAIVAVFVAWRAGARRVIGVAAMGLVLALLFAWPPFAKWRQASTLPAIHDVSTDTADPPQFVAIVPLRADAPNRLDYSAEVAAQQKAAYPDIGPALLPQAPAQALKLAERAAHEMDWTVVFVDPAALRLEATATTRLFGFRDDVVVRITPSSVGSRIDVRSVSRVGRGDIGANAQRIREYLRTLGELSRGAA